jgi:hypothetical protein
VTALAQLPVNLDLAFCLFLFCCHGCFLTPPELAPSVGRERGLIHPATRVAGREPNYQHI